MQPPINTTSDDIAAWRENILSALRRDLGYGAALEADAENQRKAEALWLDDEIFFPFWGDLDAGAVSLDAAPALKNFYGSGSVSRVMAGSVAISAAPEAVSYASKHLFIGGLDRHGVNPDAVMCVKVAVGGDAASVADIRHEATISIFGTNAFRIFIPNFPFVYAYARARMSAKEMPRVVASPRRTRGRAATGESDPIEIVRETPCLIVENIEPHSAVTLTSALATMRPADFYAVLLQIILALKFAYDRIGFTHYDLHTDNVLLRRVDGGDGESPSAEQAWFYIPYEYGRVFVAAKYVATFVDFGFSHALLHNSAKRQVCFGFAAPGRASLVELGIFRDRPNAMTDVYRLLMTSAVAAREAANGPLLTELTHLVTYFNQTEPLSDIMERQQKNFYYLPLTAHARAYNFDDFLAFARKAARPHVQAAKTPTLIMTTAPKKVPILLSGSGFMDSTRFVLQIEPLTHHYVPSAFAAFFDTHTSISYRLANTSDTRPELIKEIRADFTRAYMKGYAASKNSAFNRSLTEAKMHTASLAVAAIDATSTDLSTGGIVRALRACSIMMETRRAAAYTIALYWAGKLVGREDPPPDVAAAMAEIDDHIINTCALIAHAEQRLITTTNISESDSAMLERLHCHIFSTARGVEGGS